MVAVCQEHVMEGGEDARLVRAEMTCGDEVERGSRFRLVFVMPMRIVPTAAICHLFCCQAKQEEVLLARLFSHLNGRTIAGTDRERSIHHELHVASAAGLVPGRGDLVRDITGWNQLLRDTDGVVGQENDFDPATHRRVTVDGRGEIVQKLDDEL